MMLYKTHRQGGGMHDWIPVAVGALVGSTVAAWWRKAIRWALQVVSGSWFGAVTGHWLIYAMEWPSTPDFLLMAGSIMGLLGFSIVDGVMRINFNALIARYARARAGKLEQE